MTILEAAHLYVQAGFSVIPLQPRGKRPLFAWAEYQHRLANEAEMSLWFGAGYRPLSNDERDLWWRKAKEPKEPPTDKRLREMFAAGNKNNLGIVTGEVSDLVVLDCDDAAAIKIAEERGVGNGPRVLTSRGCHFWFRFHKGARNWQKKADNMDFRGEGGYTSAPPSVHEDGTIYRWQNSHAERPNLPQWLIPIAQVSPPLNNREYREVTLSQKLKRASSYLATIGGAVSGSGGHDQTWGAALSVARGFALPMAVAAELLETEYNPRCDPPWTRKEIEHKVADASTSSRLAFGYLLDKDFEPIRATPPMPPPPPQYAETSASSSAHEYATPEPAPDLDAFNYTDSGNANRLVRLYGTELRFSHQRKKWYHWDTKRWRDCSKGEEWAFATRTALAILDDKRRAENNNGQLGTIEKFSKRSESAGSLSSMLALAKAITPIPLTVEDFDRNTEVMCVDNGTIELKTQGLREHRRDDLITQMASVRYDPDAQCPQWIEFLETVFNWDQDMIWYLQEVLGYCLSGDISEQSLWLFYGGGANGKNTLCNVILKVFGDYGRVAPHNLLIAKQNEPHPTERAFLMGARFVMAEESEESAKFSEGVVKHLTSGSPITARWIGGDFFQFLPTSRIFFLTNHKPEVRGTEKGIWRRLKGVEFAVEIAKEKQIRNLDVKLAAEEGPGILNWMLEGLKRYYAQGGLNEPEKVRLFGEAYRNEMDVLADFLEECCVVEPAARIPRSKLYKRYAEWTKENKNYCFSAKRFWLKIKEKVRERTGQTLVFEKEQPLLIRGINLLENEVTV